MNQDNYLEESFKFRNLLEEFDPLRAADGRQQRDQLTRPNPANNGALGARASGNGVLKCAILGFRENIFTANLMSVGTYMSLMEATFVSITLRTFAWLGSRMHYGHPDCEWQQENSERRHSSDGGRAGGVMVRGDERRELCSRFICLRVCVC